MAYEVMETNPAKEGKDVKSLFAMAVILAFKVENSESRDTH